MEIILLLIILFFLHCKIHLNKLDRVHKLCDEYFKAAGKRLCPYHRIYCYGNCSCHYDLTIEPLY